MSIKSIKEKQLLINLAKSFGQEVDHSLVEEVNNHEKLINTVKENIRSNVITDLSKALLELRQNADKVVVKNNSIPSILDNSNNTKIEENPKLNFVFEEVVKNSSDPSITDLVSNAISKSVKAENFQQPDPLLVDADISAIQRKIKFLEQWLGKISTYGPGGGAGSVTKLDHETTLINSSNYNITSKDYYIGINYAGNVTLTLPSITNNGRTYIIKDESGNCSVNPITVLGTVDNDAGGFILQQDNGGVQLIYRSGWRIV